MKELPLVRLCEWDERIVPRSRRALLERLKARGHAYLLLDQPLYRPAESALFDEGMEHGYLLKKQNGDVFQTDMWQPGMAIVDFTNPEACEVVRCQRCATLCDMGVDCFQDRLRRAHPGTR